MENDKEAELIKYLKRTGETNKRKIAKETGLSYSYVLYLFKLWKRTGTMKEERTYRFTN